MHNIVVVVVLRCRVVVERGEIGESSVLALEEKA